MPPKFVPRQRKQKHRQNNSNHATVDTNAAEIQPISKSEREARKQKLREELRAQHTKISAKKQKRLDKYIENKLKKEENIELLRKLEKAKVDTSALQSSKELGKRKREDANIGLATATKAVSVSQNQISDSELSGDETDDSFVNSKSTSKPKLAETAPAPPIPAPAVGGGLKRPLELGPDGFPVLKKRKRAPKVKPVIVSLPEVSWEGFDSDSGNGWRERRVFRQ
ncbi:hypothetical protein CNMCM6106_004159 [Aspergillus hiratsukae]|uniref:Uncharacterized protein n=1 Tax=Aspergillus hiratsukae TaxID=1194566 RepID=A0A8H6UX04_9EURO|nr:hypothetical protein CNMCM6106_004159 [Aspergillus hiratsukae]